MVDIVVDAVADVVVVVDPRPCRLDSVILLLMLLLILVPCKQHSVRVVFDVVVDPRPL